MSNQHSKAENMALHWKQHQASVRVYTFETDRRYLAIAERVGSPSSTVTLFDLSRGLPAMWTGQMEITDPQAGPAPGRLSALMSATPAPLGDVLRVLGADGTGSIIARRSVEDFLEKVQDPKTRARIPVQGLIDIEQKRLSAAGLDSIRNLLDPDAINALKLCPDASFRAYAHYADKGPKRDDRLQAAASYPLLAEFMVNRISVRRAIDARKPIGPLLQQAFGGISKGTLKRVAGLQWPSRGLSAERVMHALSTIPPDWVPTDRENWEAFCDVAASVGSTLTDITGNSPQTLYAGCQGKWVDYRARLARATSDTRPPEGSTEEDLAYINANVDHKALEKANSIKAEGMIDAMVDRLDKLAPHLTKDDVRDWLVRLYAPPADQDSLVTACRNVADTLRVFSEKVTIPVAAYKSEKTDAMMSAAIDEAAMKASSSILFEGQSAVNILSTSRHVHSQMPTLLEAGPDLLAELENEEEKNEQERLAEQSLLLQQLGVACEAEWAPITEVTQAPNGMYVVPLCATSLLKEEGRRLSHCVGGYTSACKSRGHHIVSVRDAGGNSLSTAEISPIQAGSTELKVIQHRAKSNGRPGALSDGAFNWWKTQVSVGAIPLNYEGVQEYLSNLGQSVSFVRKVCGYDWQDQESLKRALYPWGRYVPKKYRSMNIDRFADTPEVMNVVRTLHPGYDRMMRRRVEEEAEMERPAMSM